MVKPKRGSTPVPLHPFWSFPCLSLLLRCCASELNVKLLLYLLSPGIPARMNLDHEFFSLMEYIYIPLCIKNSLKILTFFALPYSENRKD